MILDVDTARRFGMAARIGRQPTEDDLKAFGPVRVWRPITDAGTLDVGELVRPLSARKPWTWALVGGDPWALANPLDASLIVAVCASAGQCFGRQLYLLETGNPESFARWKHQIMREGNAALVAYRGSDGFLRSSAARAALDPPMRDPEPPTPEVRRLYDLAMERAEELGIVWPQQAFGHRLPECHWQEWPIQHVLVAGVNGLWDR